MALANCDRPINNFNTSFEHEYQDLVVKRWICKDSLRKGEHFQLTVPEIHKIKVGPTLYNVTTCICNNSLIDIDIDTVHTLSMDGRHYDLLCNIMITRYLKSTQQSPLLFITNYIINRVT